MVRFEKVTDFGKFITKYGSEMVSRPTLNRAGTRAHEIAEVLTGPRREQRTAPLWEKFEGKTVLDLGCGNGQQIDGNHPPYLAPLLAAQGATVYGIDTGEAPADTGGYTHIKRDLVALVMNGTLSQVEELKGVTFDIVNSSAFIGEGFEGSPALRKTLEAINVPMETFTEKLLVQLSQMVKENGYVFIEEKRYQNKMVDGKLKLDPVPEDSSN